MPAVLVHGVPETAELWTPLRAHLGRDDVLALSLPGFGCERPEGFGATKEEYLDWLIGEIEAAGERGPVDLVGHDWGGLLVVRLVSTRPELVRSWATDAAGVASPDFAWHDYARIWQTPGEGEAFFEAILAAPPAERGELFEALGVPPEWASRLGGWADETMAECILALYRSAVDIGEEWGPGFTDIATPGLVLAPGNDPFGSVARSQQVAARAGSQFAELEGLGHWWMLEGPAQAASVLEDLWGSSP